MELDDFAEPEVAIAVGVTAAVAAAAASPTVRRAMRKGMVYGLAGLLIAKDKVMGMASRAAASARQAITSARTPAEGGTASAGA